MQKFQTKYIDNQSQKTSSYTQFNISHFRATTETDSNDHTLNQPSELSGSFSIKKGLDYLS